MKHRKQKSILDKFNLRQWLVYLFLIVFGLTGMTVYSQETDANKFAEGKGPLLVDCGPDKFSMGTNPFKLNSNEWFNTQTGEMIPENELKDLLFEFPDSKINYVSGSVHKIVSLVLYSAGFICLGTSYLPLIEEAKTISILEISGTLGILSGYLFDNIARNLRRSSVQKYNRHILQPEE